MRIIAGAYAKRRLATLKSWATRPTSDKVKESLFNSLGQFFNGGQVLDLYAGSGALALEAVSRGYDQAVLVDKSQAACKIIKKNIEICGQTEKFELLHCRSQQAIKILAEQGRKFDLIFLDPPYAQEQIAKDMTLLAAKKLLAPGAIVVAENDEKTEIDAIPGYSLLKQHHLGRTTVRIYQVSEAR